MKCFLTFIIVLLTGSIAYVQEPTGQGVQPIRGSVAGLATTLKPQEPLAVPRVQSLPGRTQKNATYPGEFFARQYGQLSHAHNQKQAQLQRKVDTKLKEYKRTEESDKKSEIEKELKELLSEQFDARLESPQSRVEQSQNRLKELRKQIDDRQDKADEIVELRLKVIIHEAIGLGWGSRNPRLVTGVYYENPQAEKARRYLRSMGLEPAGFAPAAPSAYGGAVSPTTQWSQRAATPKVGVPLPQKTVVGFPSNVASGQRLATGYPLSSSQKQAKADDKPTLPQLLADYKKAEDSTDRKPIEKAIRELLEKEFDAYQDQMTKSADSIEDQIEELESNIKKRKKMKSSIVDLKLQTLINQANGLGF